MRAAWYEELGPAREVLQVGEQPTVTAGPGEVRMKLHASGINPSDVKRRGGYGRYTKPDGPIVIPNSDGAGVIDQIGAGVSEEMIGQRVWLFNGQRLGRTLGTAAEYIALDAKLVTPLPEGVSFAAGACLGIPCMTAHYGVFSEGPVKGKTVLVTGGAGAVGHYAIQLAKRNGAEVIATVSGPEKAAEAKAAGADHVLNYRGQDIGAEVRALTGGKGIDHVCEVDFGGNLAANLQCVAQNGSITTYATDGDKSPALPVGDLMARCITIRIFVLNLLPRAKLKQAQNDISRWLAEGECVHRVPEIYPMAEIAAAHEAVEAYEKFGTIVVDPSR